MKNLSIKDVIILFLFSALLFSAMPSDDKVKDFERNTTYVRDQYGNVFLITTQGAGHVQATFIPSPANDKVRAKANYVHIK